MTEFRGRTASELAKILGLDENGLERLLVDEERRGHVMRDDDGRWLPTEALLAGHGEAFAVFESW